MKRGQLGRNPASSPTLLSLPFARAPRSGPARLPSSHPLTARARMSASTPPLSPSPNLARVHGRRHRRSPSSIRAIKAKICAPEHGYTKPVVPSLFAPKIPFHSAPRPPDFELGGPPRPSASSSFSGELRRPRALPLPPFFLICFVRIILTPFGDFCAPRSMYSSTTTFGRRGSQVRRGIAAYLEHVDAVHRATLSVPTCCTPW